MSILFRFVIASLPRSKCLLISWLQLPFTVILLPKKIKLVRASTFPLLCAMKWWDKSHDLSFLILSFNPDFSPFSFTLIKSLFSSSSLSVIRVVPAATWGCWYFSRQSWFQLVIHLAGHFTWCTLHTRCIIRVKMYNLLILLYKFWTSQLLHVQI